MTRLKAEPGAEQHAVSRSTGGNITDGGESDEAAPVLSHLFTVLTGNFFSEQLFSFTLNHIYTTSLAYFTVFSFYYMTRGELLIIFFIICQIFTIGV